MGFCTSTAEPGGTLSSTLERLVARHGHVEHRPRHRTRFVQRVVHTLDAERRRRLLGHRPLNVEQAGNRKLHPAIGRQVRPLDDAAGADDDNGARARRRGPGLWQRCHRHRNISPPPRVAAAGRRRVARAFLRSGPRVEDTRHFDIYLKVELWFVLARTTSHDGGSRVSKTKEFGMKRVCFLCVVLAVLLARPAFSQDPRGAINGRITDSSGAAMPGVTVTAKNVATNGTSTTVTNGDGDYSILYLTPGLYSVTAELSGFKKLVRDGIEVRIGDRLNVDLRLDVGRMEETVSVTAEAPLLETRSASVGQVIDEKHISLMPLSDGNPFVLSRLVPGVAYTGDLKFSRPFDNAGTSAINADGSTGGNEFTLDGSPNMANGRRVAFVPPAGAVRSSRSLPQASTRQKAIRPARW